jgi:hypothetical protein
MTRTAVTHLHKTVRRQFVDLNLPDSPLPDEEAFVLRISPGQGQVVLRPGDMQQLVGCLAQAMVDAGMPHPFIPPDQP